MSPNMIHHVNRLQEIITALTYSESYSIWTISLSITIIHYKHTLIQLSSQSCKTLLHDF